MTDPTAPLDPQSNQPPAPPAYSPAPPAPSYPPASNYPAGQNYPASNYPGGAPYPGGAQYAGQPGYGQPGYPGQPMIDPATGLAYSDKSKLVAGLLQILLGAFGAGRFYTGHTGIAIAQIAVTWLTCGLGGIWPLIDGIIILVQGGTDAKGAPLKPS